MTTTKAAAKTKKPFNLLEWAKSRKGQQAIIIVLFTIIPLTLLFVFTYYPFAEMFKFSFYDMSYTRVKKYVGFERLMRFPLTLAAVLPTVKDVLSEFSEVSVMSFTSPVSVQSKWSVKTESDM